MINIEDQLFISFVLKPNVIPTERPKKRRGILPFFKDLLYLI